jgi:phosphate-selective porin
LCIASTEASADQPASAPATQSAERTPPPAPPPPPPQPPARPAVKASALPLAASYKDGFRLASPAENLELKIGASAQLDGRFYEGSSVAPHSFDIRRARLDLQAKLFKRLDARIQAALEDNPYVRNAMADLHLWDFLILRVGQMKVPFSSTWLAFDNQVDFLERGAAEPIYPFFDRGAMLWGKLLGERVSYAFGVFAGVGVDIDATKGDIDGQKDLAWRVFLQPFRATPVKLLDGLYLAANGTWGRGSVATRRFDTRGMSAATYESQVWRWRTEQTLGTNGRNTDQIAATVDSRTRLGAELHLLKGPFTLSAEWTQIDYGPVTIYHDFYQGSKRLKHESVLEREGKIQNVSAFLSVFLTGEEKFLDLHGWKQPNPKRPLTFKERGPGALELLARFSATFSDKALFDTAKVAGYATTDFTDPNAKLAGAATGEGASVTAAVLEGAPTLYEVTVGANWTMNYHFRLMLNYTYLYAPDFDASSGSSKHGIVSGGNSDLYDTTIKNKLVKSEHMLGFRCIIRI